MAKRFDPSRLLVPGSCIRRRRGEGLIGIRLIRPVPPTTPLERMGEPG